MFDIRTFGTYLETICTQYAKTAPTVARWADDLYIRTNESRITVTLDEILTALTLGAEGWYSANYAANMVYKCMERHGQSTTGLASY